MKAVWVRKSRSFDEAKRFEDTYYAQMGSRKRVETVQFLREIFFKLRRRQPGASREGLRRSLRILKQI